MATSRVNRCLEPGLSIVVGAVDANGIQRPSYYRFYPFAPLADLFHRAVRKSGQRDFASFANGHDSGHIFRARTPSALVSTTVEQRLQQCALANIESTDALRSMHFVA